MNSNRLLKYMDVMELRTPQKENRAGVSSWAPLCVCRRSLLCHHLLHPTQSKRGTISYTRPYVWIYYRNHTVQVAASWRTGCIRHSFTSKRTHIPLTLFLHMCGGINSLLTGGRWCWHLENRPPSRKKTNAPTRVELLRAAAGQFCTHTLEYMERHEGNNTEEI